jgi:hypothetical protein
MLPKKSAICKQFRKCGKPSCKCNTGSLHGPYFFYFYREDGKLKKQYIRKADAPELWEGYSQRRAQQKQRAADRREFTEFSRELRRLNQFLSPKALEKLLGGYR